MPARCPPITRPRLLPGLLTGLLRLMLYNTAIAAFLTLIWQYDFMTNLTYAQCIGFGIAAAHSALSYRRGGGDPQGRDAFLAIPFGFLAGFTLAGWLSGLDLEKLLDVHPHGLLGSAATALIFGSVAAYYFSSLARLEKARREVEAERMRRLEQEKAATQAELTVLQAQIEPHFLFNTLGAATGLIEGDPQAAKAMLLDLTTLLRGTLLRTRRQNHALDEELTLVRAYLDIMARRMGQRLAWHIDTDASLGAIPVPPLLLQPVVENAIRHGLEPLEAGGSLRIHIQRQASRFSIAVIDNGCGWPATAPASHGIGLQNLRARLHAAYDGQARLDILPNNPEKGLTVCLDLPLPEGLPCAS